MTNRCSECRFQHDDWCDEYQDDLSWIEWLAEDCICFEEKVTEK